MSNYLKDFNFEDEAKILKRLELIKKLKFEQIENLDVLSTKFKVDIKRIEMIVENKLPVREILEFDTQKEALLNYFKDGKHFWEIYCLKGDLFDDCESVD